MAAGPSRMEIQTLFKRLRAAPANKVLDSESGWALRSRVVVRITRRFGAELTRLLIRISLRPRRYPLDSAPEPEGRDEPPSRGVAA